MQTNLETTGISIETLLIIVCLNISIVSLSIEFYVGGYFPLAFGTVTSSLWNLFVLMKTLLLICHFFLTF